MCYACKLLEVYESIINSNEIDNIKTGFIDIDDMLSGTQKGSLLIVGGRPSMGKTCFMMSILENLLRDGHKCAYFSIEMSKEMFIKRFLCQCAEVESHHIRAKNITQKVIDKFKVTLGKISDYNLFVEDNSYLTIEILEEKIKEIKPEYVFIDYLQLMHIKSNKVRNEEFTKLMFELKRIAKENNLFIFIASQLSRAVENRYDKFPMLSDLKETSTIEEIAEVVMLIYRDDYYNIPNDEGIINKNRATIFFAKNKSGPTGAVDLLFKSSIPKFCEQIRFEDF